MLEYSLMKGRVDHEVRFVGEKMWSVASTDEPIFFNKIASTLPYSAMLQDLLGYFDSCRLNGIVLRSLPFLTMSNYVENLESVCQFGEELGAQLGFEVSYIVPIRPSEHSDCIKIAESLFGKRLVGFELISSWYNEPIDSSMFLPFLSSIDLKAYVLCIEIDHMFRSSSMHLHQALSLLKSFSPSSLWFPHLGCGTFLYPSIFGRMDCDIVLLSSVPKSLFWIQLCRSIESTNMKIAYASDIPFNGQRSLGIYNTFFPTRHVKQ
jgi:hypothetical protein